MKYEKTCGAVLVDNSKVLMVKQSSGIWGFSKGHMEDSETEIDTVLRKIKKETNVIMDIDVDKKLLLNNLNDVINDEKFKTESNTINSIIKDIKQIDVNNLDLVLLDKIKEEIQILEKNYLDINIYEISYVYDPLYIYFKKIIHKNDTSKVITSDDFIDYYIVIQKGKKTFKKIVLR